MGLVFRRAGRARGLLAAAATATLLATVLLTALRLYGGLVIDSGTRAAVAAAPPTERTVLVSGSISDRDDVAGLDRSVTRAVGRGLRGGVDAGGGVDPGGGVGRDGDVVATDITRAGYAVGQQLPGGMGDAKPGDDGLVLASVMFLEDLAEHARLTSGNWPEPGRSGSREPGAGGELTAETVLAAPVAKLLDVEAGDDIPLTDRRGGTHRTLRVTGIWEPADPADPYWLLVPELRTGVVAGTATHGPFVVSRTDFLRHFATLASLNWLITPDLTDVTAAQLRSVSKDAKDVAKRLDGDVASSTGIGELAERLGRSAVVARSALLVPVLLLVVIAGYALLLVAGLLHEQRRAETALVRARGAGVWQLAGLAATEAGFVIGPALLLGAPLAVALLSLVDRVPRLARLGLRLDPGLTGSAWLVAAAAAFGCGLALVAPALRRGTTYVAEQQARSRAVRRGLLQRAGIDLALVGLAVLAWFQLRQYGSPLLGLDVDPVLVAAPTIGVLAATVLALRLLPLLTRAGQRAASSRHSFGLLLGTWQAGRRPHAGTVLLLSLAVGVATLAICLEGTSARSATDQASHRAGADLRLVESGLAPGGRATQLGGIPGVDTVLPAVQETVTIGSGSASTLLMLDTERAAAVMRPREDLTDSPPAALFERLAGRDSLQPIPFPPGAVRLTGEITVTASRPGMLDDVSSTLDVRDRHGVVRGVSLTGATPNQGPVRFDVSLGAAPDAGYGLRLNTHLERRADLTLTWKVRNLATVDTGGRRTPLDVSGSWQVGDGEVDPLITASRATVTAKRGGISVSRRVTVDPTWSAPVYPALSYGFQIGRPGDRTGRVDVLVTPRVLRDIGGTVGTTFRLPVLGADAEARVAGVIQSVPGVSNERALLADLDTLTEIGYAASGTTPRPTEWRLATDADTHAAVARRLARLNYTETVDRYAVAVEPLGAGARLVLLPAALAAALLAALGIAVDVRATAASRSGELAALHTVGSPPRTLARALITEHGLLAGLGVLTGIAVGVLVAWAMGPLLILTPEASRPMPTPVLVADPLLIGVPAAALLLVAVGLAATIATGIRRNLAVLVVESSR